MAHTWCKKPHCTHSHTAPPSGAPPRRHRVPGRGPGFDARISLLEVEEEDPAKRHGRLVLRLGRPRAPSRRSSSSSRPQEVKMRGRPRAQRPLNGPCAAAAATARRIAATTRRSSEEQLGSNTTAVERGRPRAPGRRPRRTGAFTHLHCHTSILIRPYLSHTIYFQLQLP